MPSIAPSVPVFCKRKHPPSVRIDFDDQLALEVTFDGLSIEHGKCQGSGVITFASLRQKERALCPVCAEPALSFHQLLEALAHRVCEVENNPDLTPLQRRWLLSDYSRAVSRLFGA